VRCSSCEPLLDRYLEGTLTPREMSDVTLHLKHCQGCSELLDELKSVDALLFTTRVPDLPENFTFAVMAEVGALPAPQAREHPLWSFLVLYCAAAWAAVVLGLALSKTSPVVLLQSIASALHSGVLANALAASVSEQFSHMSPALAAFAFAMLLIDAVLAAAVALIYFNVRPRLAARLASSAEIHR
jgi:anti-sigma factor RsiW